MATNGEIIYGNQTSAFPRVIQNPGELYFSEGSGGQGKIIGVASAEATDERFFSITDEGKIYLNLYREVYL